MNLDRLAALPEATQNDLLKANALLTDLLAEGFDLAISEAEDLTELGKVTPRQTTFDFSYVLQYQLLQMLLRYGQHFANLDQRAYHQSINAAFAALYSGNGKNAAFSFGVAPAAE